MGVSEFAMSAEANEMGSKEVAGKSKDSIPIEKFDEIKKNQINDDREEGEIVDDYEFIISSDEELCMRQRIEELEAKNAELEKIAHITDGYVNEYSYSGKHDTRYSSNERYPLTSINVLNSMDCQRAAQVPTDASSISSVEFPTPKKRKRRLSKVTKREQRNQHRSDYKKHKHSSRRSNMNRTRYQKDIEPIQLDSFESSDGNLSANDSSTCYLSREELRFALARSSHMEKNAASLKDRLIKKIVNLNEKNEFETDTSALQSPEPIVVEDDNSDDSVSLEEQELRLIALKSAVMKKHLARKKRDAEVAYSPTDFDDLLAGSAILNQVVDIEELDNDTRNSMEISPVASPKLQLTPDNAENSRMSMASDIIEITEAVNTKPVDMDIANSESEDELQSYYYENKKWMPIEEIPLPAISGSSIGIPANLLQTPYEGIFYPTPIHYANFYTKAHLEPPPLPPGVFDFEELPPPPPPFHLHSPPSEVFNLSKVKIEKNICADSNIRKPDIKSLNESDPANLLIDIDKSESLEKKEKYLLSHDTNKTVQSGEDDDEEEEEALRALLLSKLNSPRACKSNHNISKRVSSPITSELSQEAEDPETLRSLLLSSISNRKMCQNPTESILKEAVRRLKLKTYSTNILRKNENKFNLLQESQCHSPVVIDTHLDQSEEFEHEKDNSLLLSEQDLISSASNCVEMDSKNLVQDSVSVLEGFGKSEEVHKSNKIQGKNCTEKFLEKPTEPKHIMSDVSDVQIFEKPIDEDKSSNNTKEVLENNTESANKLFQGVECLKTSNQINSNTQTLNVLCKNSDSQDNEIVVAPVEFVQSVKSNPKSHVETSNLLVKETVQTNSADTSISSPFNKENMADKRPILDSNVSNNTSAKITRNKTSTTDVPLLNFSEMKVPLRSNKIVKPNKVINTQSIKRKSVETKPFLSKKLKSSSSPASPTLSSTANTNYNNSRLVTSANISSLQVKKLIITLRASESETSEDELQGCVANVNKNRNEPQFESNDTISCTANNYYDNASPISLPMNSPGDTPKRVDSPNGETSMSNGFKVLSECFEKKLDTFLKSVRSKVQHTSTATTNDIMELEERGGLAESLKTFSTPLAVRHLPHASQQEYRRLVHRMQLLEKQKQAKKIDNGDMLADISHQKQIFLNDNFPKISSTNDRVPSTLSTSSYDISNNTLVKTVLLKNANKTTSDALSSSQTKKSNVQQTSKSNVLRAYESSFLKTGAGIITNLDKSLKLVEEAKQAKITKLRCEKRMNELRREMEELQQKLRQGQLKMSKIYPDICASNDVITTLKQRRVKLFKAATNLGKTIKGDEYRLNNDLKQLISVKSKKLAAEIKLVNSLQIPDAGKLIHKDKMEVQILDVNNALHQNPDKEQSVQNVTITANHIVPSTSEIETKKTDKENSLSEAPSVQEEDQKLSMHNKSSDYVFTKKQTKNCSPLSEEISLDNVLMKEQTKNCSQHSEEITLDICVESNNKIDFCKNDGNKSCFEISGDPEHMLELAKKNNEAMSAEVTLAIGEDDDGVSLKSQHVREYISPLAHFKTEGRQLDPNGIICPYDLMGQCVDNDCSFVHLSMKSSGNVRV